MTDKITKTNLMISVIIAVVVGGVVFLLIQSKPSDQLSADIMSSGNVMTNSTGE